MISFHKHDVTLHCFTRSVPQTFMQNNSYYSTVVVVQLAVGTIILRMVQYVCNMCVHKQDALY